MAKKADMDLLKTLLPALSITFIAATAVGAIVGFFVERELEKRFPNA